MTSAVKVNSIEQDKSQERKITRTYRVKPSGEITVKEIEERKNLTVTQNIVQTKNIKVEQKKTVTESKAPQYSVEILTNFDKGSPLYTGNLSMRVFHNIWVGGWANNQSEFGVSARLDF